MPQRPPLIVFMADVSARTQFITQYRDHIESLPFDGMVVNIPASWSLMSPGTVLTRAEVQTWLTPLKPFNNGMENYLQVNIDDPGDLFDDAAWAQVTANWQMMARVAAATGFTGILFDNEEYAGHWENFPQDYPPGDAARGLDAYRAMASQRGREIMQAIAAVMPDGKVAFAHGPYASVPATSAAPPAIEQQMGDWHGQELRGPLFTGFVEGMGPGQTMIDAGELYALRSAAEFAQSFDYRENLLPGLIPWQVDPAVLANWGALVDQGHMIYTDAFPPGYTHTPETIVATLLNAFDHSEGAVFLYSEIGQLGWFAPQTLPQAWLDAVTLAVSLADHTTHAGHGNNRIGGTGVAERIFSGAGNDFVAARGGGDLIYGGGGRDTLRGGDGDDKFYGGAGQDQMTGGAGTDTFVLSAISGQDAITDFDPVTDIIMVPDPASLSLWQGSDGLHLLIGSADILLKGVTATLADLTLV